MELDAFVRELGSSGPTGVRTCHNVTGGAAVVWWLFETISTMCVHVSLCLSVCICLNGRACVRLNGAHMREVTHVATAPATRSRSTRGACVRSPAPRASGACGINDDGVACVCAFGFAVAIVRDQCAHVRAAKATHAREHFGSRSSSGCALTYAVWRHTSARYVDREYICLHCGTGDF